jgi:hypothetical protein
MTQIITTSDLASFMNGQTLVSSISTQVVAAVNAFIETRTKRSWGEIQTVTETYDFRAPLWLRHQDVIVDGSMPIVVKIGYPNVAQQTIASTGYFANSLGRLTLYFAASSGLSVRNNDLLQVTYSYGVLGPQIPEDLKTASLSIAQRLYNHVTNNGQDIVASSVGSYRVESIGAIRGTGSGGPNPAMNTSEMYFQIVDGYATKRF